MSISLEKRTEAALVSLQKIVDDSPIDLGDLSAQVTISCDRSASASNQWPDLYQEAVERALALTLTGLDDDGQVPFIAFDSRIVGEVVLSADGANGTESYVDFVRKFHMGAGQMGGTLYGPVIEKLLSTGSKKKRFGRSSDNDEADQPPFLHLFFTDGEPSDKAEVERLLIKARTRPHFFQFILVGGNSGGERYLQRLNKELSGAGIDNVGVTIYSGHPPTDDTGFFNDVIREFFTEWLPEARKRQYTRK